MNNSYKECQLLKQRNKLDIFPKKINQKYINREARGKMHKQSLDMQISFDYAVKQ